MFITERTTAWTSSASANVRAAASSDLPSSIKHEVPMLMIDIKGAWDASSPSVRRLALQRLGHVRQRLSHTCPVDSQAGYPCMMYRASGWPLDVHAHQRYDGLDLQRLGVAYAIALRHTVPWLSKAVLPILLIEFNVVGIVPFGNSAMLFIHRPQLQAPRICSSSPSCSEALAIVCSNSAWTADGSSCSCSIIFALSHAPMAGTYDSRELIRLN